MAALLLLLAAGLLGAPAGSSCAPEDGGACAADEKSLLQIRKDKEDKVMSAKSPEHICRNLVVFLDGSGNELNKSCAWLPNKTCESNIALLWRLTAEVPESSQLTHYEPGVAWSGSVGENFNSGVGTKTHMLNSYAWLAQHYEACDEIMLFGFSRGTLSARMLQGMIHRVGLAKPGYVSEAVGAHFGRDKDAAMSFKASDKAWPGVRVKFMGLFDSVLRTLLHPVKHRNIESFRMKLTSSVDNLAHAIALGEYREIFQAAELYTHPSTLATQVWFLGGHGDVGGCRPNTPLARIAGGWMADEAVKAGFLLPPDWRGRPEMRADVLGDASTENGLGGVATMLGGVELERALRIATVRDPARCRAELGKKDEKVLLHQSVKDRMDLNPGWVPLQWCCKEVKSAMDKFGIEFVSNDHYDATRAAPRASAAPSWIKLSFGLLENAVTSEVMAGSPEYFLTLLNWHTESGRKPPELEGARHGCCSPVTAHPHEGERPSVRNVGSGWWPSYKADVDFRGVEAVLPYEPAVANYVMIELHEDDFFSDDDFLGRAQIMYSEFGKWKTLSLGVGATLQARADLIFTDKDAEALLGPGDYAACRWLDETSHMSRDTMCRPSGMDFSWLLGSGVGNPVSCADMVEDVTTGAL